MRIFLLLIIAVHGLIHLMGFAKAFQLAEMEQLVKPISKTSGVIWLTATVLFLVTLTLFVLKSDKWWYVGLLAVVVSQALIIGSWSDAKWGTIANLIILIPVFIAFMGSLPSAFKNIYRMEVENSLQSSDEDDLLEESDLQHLPDPVKKYLRYVGAVGQPKVNNFKLVFDGQMKMKEGSDWVNVRSEQYNFFDSPARFFYVQSELYGVPFDGLHIFKNNIATMQIRLAHLINVVDAKGEEMNQSETVTFFNDLCLFAPAALIDKNIKWMPIDSSKVEAVFTDEKYAIKAQLYFNEKGALVNFISDDRFMSNDGNDYRKVRWSTPVESYKSIEGRRIPKKASAIWHLPGAEFEYAKFNVEKVAYNCWT